MTLLMRVCERPGEHDPHWWRSDEGRCWCGDEPPPSPTPLRGLGRIGVPHEILEDFTITNWAVIPPNDEPCPHPGSAHRLETREVRVNGFLTLGERTESCQRCGAITSYSSLKWDTKQSRFVAHID